MSAPNPKSNRRKKLSVRPLEADPEVLLAEEVNFIPLSMHIEKQVRKLRSLEKALYKAGRPTELQRRAIDQSATSVAINLGVTPEQRNKYLIPLKVPLKLQAGELCYLRAAAEWLNVGGIELPPAHVPDPALPSKHLSIRRRGETPDHPSSPGEKKLAPGYFYLTNQRIIMVCADKRRLSIKLRAAYRRTVYRNAIEIHHFDSRLGRPNCDNFYLPDGDIELADSLFQCLG